MSIYDEKPWLAGYPAGRPRAITPEFGDALSMFAATVARTPDSDAIRYFDGRIGFAELDALTDAFAVGLLDAGVAAGDRLALYLQNVPQFVIALLGTWKAGAVAVSVSPMNREKELGLLLRDSGARALVCLRGLHEDVAVHALGDTDVRLVVTTSEREHQTRGDGRVLADSERRTPAGTVDMAAMLGRFRGATPPAVAFGPDDVAVLTYTSGTTGPPKGAMNTHGNVAFNAQTYREWARIGPDDVILGVAPLFRVTGLIAHVGLSLLTGAPLVLTGSSPRQPAVQADRVRLGRGRGRAPARDVPHDPRAADLHGGRRLGPRREPVEHLRARLPRPGQLLGGEAGVQGFTKTVAVELGRFGITVNAIGPGYIDTEMTRATAERVGVPFDEYAAMAAKEIPVGRVGRPEDVANVVSFFVSDDASFVSGRSSTWRAARGPDLASERRVVAVRSRPNSHGAPFTRCDCLRGASSSGRTALRPGDHPVGVGG